jgi:hypothetical protein
MFTDTCIKYLGQMLNRNKSIQIISLSNDPAYYTRGFSDSGIETLSKVLLPNINTTFRSIDFKGQTKLTDESLPYLIRILQNSRIEDINIDETKITSRGDIVEYICINRLKNGNENIDLSRKYVYSILLYIFLYFLLL